MTCPLSIGNSNPREPRSSEARKKLSTTPGRSRSKTATVTCCASAKTSRTELAVKKEGRPRAETGLLFCFCLSLLAEAYPDHSATHDDFHAPVQLPPRRSAVFGDGVVLAQSLGRDGISRQPLRNQELRHGVRPLFR